MSYKGTVHKVLDLAAAARLCADWTGQGLVVGLTNGCFDLLHTGHLSYLETARQNCDRLVVAVNSDESVRRLKGPSRPIVSENDRARMMAGLECVDLVTIFDESTADEVIRRLKPAVYVKGGDYNAASLPEYSTLTEYGVRVVFVHYEQNRSTSGIIDTILNRSNPSKAGLL